MPTSKLTKRTIDAVVSPASKQLIYWDTEIKGFGLRVLPSGLKPFIVQYRNAEGIQRRMNLVLMRLLHSRRVSPVGVMISDREMIHVESATSVAVVPIDHYSVSGRITGFARYVPWEL